VLKLIIPILCFIFSLPANGATLHQTEISRLVRQNLHCTHSSNISFECQKLINIKSLFAFYQPRNFSPVWVNEEGFLHIAKDLLYQIEKSSLEGLQPFDYHLSIIKQGLSSNSQRDQFQAAKMEVILSDAFMSLGTHLRFGRINPQSIDPDRTIPPGKLDIATVLQTATNSAEISQTLNSLVPKHKGYKDLKKALAKYQYLKKQGGWPILPPGTRLSPGDSSKQVIHLKQRLQITGDFFPKMGKRTSLSPLFHRGVQRALIRFQARHGIKASGKVDEITLSALNMTPQEYINQIIINLERWRWIPRDLGSRYIVVNIPDFKLELIEKSVSVFKSRVIVGSGDTPTPELSDIMSALVINPHWYIPPTIVIKNILPQVKKDPQYLITRNIKVFKPGDLDKPEKAIDPFTINWHKIFEDKIPYHFVQDPGPTNVLGAFKFVLPNRFSIYLHDARNRTLYEEISRKLSNGCIRVEKSLQLAEYLLKPDAKWNSKRIRAIVKQRTPIMVSLPKPVAVHLYYWTAWVDELDMLQLRKDIYDKDKPLLDKMIP
jgi:L,D-transpeptidase YcbB